MRRFFQKILRVVMILGIGLMISGCILEVGFPLFATLNEDETITLSISSTNRVSNCEVIGPKSRPTITCVFEREFFDGSTFETSRPIFPEDDLDPLSLLFIDPMVVQFPLDASNFSGSFLHSDTATNGNLVINAGLASVRADLNQTLTAEPGTQLVTIDLPNGAPTEGDFAFNLNFVLPPGTTSLSMKPMFTGRVTVDGETFYSPLLPCVTDFADAPSIDTPIPAPGDQVTIPPIAGLGCDNVTYNYGTAAAGPTSTAIPALTQWGLILLFGFLGFAGIYYMKRRVY